MVTRRTHMLDKVFTHTQENQSIEEIKHVKKEFRWDLMILLLRRQYNMNVWVGESGRV